MKRTNIAISVAALLLAAMALYVVLSAPAVAQGDAGGPNKAGTRMLKVAVVDYESLFTSAKVVLDRQAEASRMITDLYFEPGKAAEEKLQKKQLELDEMRSKTVGRNPDAEDDVANEIEVLKKKLKMYKQEIKTAQTMLQTKFRAQAMAAIYLEISGHAKRGGFDLVLNRSNLAAKKRDAGEESDQGKDLNYSQKFSADLSNSTLLYFNGKDEFDAKKEYTIIDITSAVSDTLKKKGWDDFASKVTEYLGE